MRDGDLSFTGDGDTTRYIDLQRPDQPGDQRRQCRQEPAGHRDQPPDGTLRLRRELRLAQHLDRRPDTRTGWSRSSAPTALPPPGSQAEQVLVGAEMFFSSRGHFDRPATATISTDERLSQEGWQNCASCHFKGLTDGVVWVVRLRPAQVHPADGTFNPQQPRRCSGSSTIRRSSTRRQDFELNIRNVSGPGNAGGADACSAPPPDTSLFDKQHGLIVGDVDINQPPCVINDLRQAQHRPQPGHRHPARQQQAGAGAGRAWISGCRFAVRVPNGPLTDERDPGRRVGECDRPRAANCSKSSSARAATAAVCGAVPSRTSRRHPRSPTSSASVPSSRQPGAARTARRIRSIGNPNGGQYLDRFLRDVGSFNLGVAGAGQRARQQHRRRREGRPAIVARRRAGAAGRAGHGLQR